MAEKIDKNLDSLKENLSGKQSKEDDLRFEKQDLRILRASIEEQHQKENSLDDPEHGEYQKNIVLTKDVQKMSVGLDPISQESLQKRKESAQSVLTMVQDASHDKWVVGLLWSWAAGILDDIEV